jgi:alkanesulfonate monooxygenase SsuD/methylene tetrahydromethanopterin reductase-like flavin-dependent oxidoreductase (luciferase family)
MKIGVCLPTSIEGVSGETLLHWAKRAEELGFSTLSVMDKLASNTLEPMMVLSAVASLTRNPRLLTGVLVLPTRDPVIFAAEAATLDIISNGRLTLGVAVGSRSADYELVGRKFSTRGKAFENQLSVLRKVWSTSGEDSIDAGPKPIQKGGPELLIGGRSKFVPGRIAKWGDGYIAPSHADTKEVTLAFEEIKDAWRASGRSAKPRLVCSNYYLFESGDSKTGESYLREQYSHRPASENQSRDILKNEESIRTAIDSYKSIGADELLFRPILSDIGQLEFLGRSTSNFR